jgi:hypothetical protein
MIHFLLTLFLIVLFVRIILRLLFRPFGFGYRRHHHFFGHRWGDRYANPYAYGYRRPGIGGQLLPIFILVALDRLFGRRYW